MAEYVGREEARKILCDVCGCVHCDIARCPYWQELNKLPVADVIPRELLNQIYWERDTALHQLAEIGKGLGEKMDSIGCPHYIRNVHDRGDDSLCEKYHCEVKAVERKKAFWEKHDDGIMIWWQCPICNHEAFYDEDYLGNFCPWCGADMRGDGNDNKQA